MGCCAVTPNGVASRRSSVLGRPLGPAAFLTVTRNGARLAGQPTGQSTQELIATSVNTFFVTGIGAEIVFEVDASGKPTALVVRQNGGDTRAPRVEN